MTLAQEQLPTSPITDLYPPTEGPEVRITDEMESLHQSHAVIARDAASIYPPEDIGLMSEPKDMKLSVVGELAIPDEGTGYKHAVIIKVERKSDHRARYALQGLRVDEAGEAKVIPDKIHLIGDMHTGLGRMLLGREANSDKGLAEDSTLVSADQLWGDGARYGSSTSRKHVELVATKNGVVVRDMSVNGTLLRKVDSDPDEDAYMARHTINAVRLAKLRGYLNEKGDFGHLPHITRDTEITDGMVDIRTWGAGGEAIVIDSRDKGDSEYAEYEKLVGLFEKKFNIARQFSGRELDERDILRAVYESVSDALEYDLNYVDGVTKTVAEMAQGRREINLSWFLHDGKGVCRQMALAAGWLGTQAKLNGLLSGKMTADVNQRRADNAAHEWARYTAKDGTVYILDPAQGFFGTLAESLRSNRWNYFHEGERRKYDNQIGGNTLKHSGIIDVYDWSKDSGAL